MTNLKKSPVREGHKKLAKLARGLIELHSYIKLHKLKNKFVMARWRASKKPLLVDKPGFDCGFAGCAIGWAPKFIKGFPFVTNSRRALVRKEDPDQSFNTVDFTDLGKYFEIGTDNARYLFNDQQYVKNEGEYDENMFYNPTPTEVADRIKTLLGKYEGNERLVNNIERRKQNANQRRK